MGGLETFDEPCEVDAEAGTVIVRGPGTSFRIRFTPNAAEETSNRLLDGAMKARGLRYFDERKS